MYLVLIDVFLNSSITMLALIFFDKFKIFISFFPASSLPTKDIKYDLTPKLLRFRATFPAPPGIK